MNALVMKAFVWLHHLLFVKPKRRRITPPACPACRGRKWLAPICTSCWAECPCSRPARCQVCGGTGVVPATAIAGEADGGKVLRNAAAYGRAFSGN
jgi:hypothetical protein